MGLFVQQGYGKGTRMPALLASGAIEGWILSPFDETPGALRETATAVRGAGLELLLDPQTFVQSIPDAKAGRRPEHNLEVQGFRLGLSAQDVQAHVDVAVGLAAEIGASALLAPSPIQRGLQDPWTGLSLQFARTAVRNGGPGVRASVFIDEGALDDWTAASAWLDQITGVSDLAGVYLTVARNVSGTYPHVWSAPRLAAFLRLVHRLSNNDLDVIVGYQDIEGLAAIAAGARAIASGWSVNRRIFVEDRWRPQGGGSQPLTRVWLPDVLAPIRQPEAQTLRRDAVSRALLTAASENRLDTSNTVSQTESQIDYLTDLGRIATQTQEVPESLDDRLVSARQRLNALRRRNPTIERSHVERLDVMVQALSLFRAAEGIV